MSRVTDVRGDRAVAAVASLQYGLITRAQLVACGLTERMIATRVARGALHRLHRGVYAVGHTAPLPLRREMAAVLAAGMDAVLSHASAGYLWGLLDDPGTPVHVTLVGRSCTRPGIASHQTRRLPNADRTIRWGIPVTGPARTVIDLAASAGGDDVEQIVAEARVMRLLSEPQLRSALPRARGGRGTRRLARLLGSEHDPAFTRSAAERRLLALVRSARLPSPLVNRRVAGYEVDFYWPAERLVVEVDGFAFHSDRRAFERDRARDAALAARGLRVIRVTWRQLTEEPEAVIARLAGALAVPPTMSA